MYNNFEFELLVAREKRRDLLCRAAQNRQLRRAKVENEPGTGAGDRARGGLKVRMMWRKVIT